MIDGVPVLVRACDMCLDAYASADGRRSSSAWRDKLLGGTVRDFVSAWNDAYLKHAETILHPNSTCGQCVAYVNRHLLTEEQAAECCNVAFEAVMIMRRAELRSRVTAMRWRRLYVG